MFQSFTSFEPSQRKYNVASINRVFWMFIRTSEAPRAATSDINLENAITYLKKKEATISILPLSWLYLSGLMNLYFMRALPRAVELILRFPFVICMNILNVKTANDLILLFVISSKAWLLKSVCSLNNKKCVFSIYRAISLLDMRLSIKQGSTMQ